MRLYKLFSMAVCIFSLFFTNLYAGSVLIVGADDDSYRADVQAKIIATGLIDGNVDIFDARTSTPTPEVLRNYSAVLVYSNYGFGDKAALGNVLADFVDNGGIVVQMTFGFYAELELAMGGRWRSENRDVFIPGSQTQGQLLTLGTLHEPDNPILKDVATFSGGTSSYRNTVGGVNPNSTLIAEWSDGTPLIAISSEQSNGVIIGLNFFPPSNDTQADFWDKTSDGALLMANALTYSDVKSSRHFCQTKDAKLFCWGSNKSGQLGAGHTQVIGDEATEMGGNLAPIDLGANFVIKKVLTRGESTCALSESGQLKCFGDNTSGQLGAGNVLNLGDEPNEMGQKLLPVDLGKDVTVNDFAMGSQHVCVITNNADLKCFGNNKYGQLGVGDGRNRGDLPEQMGDKLPIVNLGSNLKAKALALGFFHTCVLLTNNSIKCFGKGASGQLGNGSGKNVGLDAKQMGDALLPVNIGSEERIVAITSGNENNCVLFASNKIKCFGSNGAGQLGLGDRQKRGDTLPSMGTSLPFVDLGIGQRAKAVKCESSYCCASLVQGTLKCWGGNGRGQLGLGDTKNRGTAIADMGDNLPLITISPGGKVMDFKLMSDYVCARDQTAWKCWGNNSDGALGYGNLESSGHTMETVPSELPYLDF